jgi:type IV pilus assembly protein PilN
MIRINLLGVERQSARKATPFLDAGQRGMLACSLILGLSVLGISAWYWQLSTEAARLDAETAAAQAETLRLKAVLAEVARAEDSRAQLKQRVQIIEDLRTGQSVPVQMLDHVSRSLPDMLWLTDLEQKDGEVNITGRTTTLIALADFVGNLGTNALVEKPIDIVSSQVEAVNEGKNSVEVVRFSVKAPLAPRSPAAAKPGAAPGGAAGAATR